MKSAHDCKDCDLSVNWVCPLHDAIDRRHRAARDRRRLRRAGITIGYSITHGKSYWDRENQFVGDTRQEAIAYLDRMEKQQKDFEALKQTGMAWEIFPDGMEGKE